jgi:hypothetical protein
MMAAAALSLSTLGTIVATSVGTTWSASAASASLTRYPYLTDVVNAGSTSNATLNFATTSSVTAAYATVGVAGRSCSSLRKSGSKTAITVNGVAENQWKVRLTGLSPGTRYCYRIATGTPSAPGTDLLGGDPSPVFSTLPARGSSTTFKFAVLGDWGATDAAGANPAQANLDARIANSGAMFVLGTGDTAYPGGSQTNYGDLHQRGPGVSTVFGPSFYKNIGDGIPMYNALGNHGMTATFLNVWPQPTAPALSGGRAQMDTYCCVNGTRSTRYPSVWYAFDAGATRVYILDSAWANSNLGTGTLYSDDKAAHWGTSSPQYRWLAADLAAHPGGLKIAVEHFPMYADSPTEGTDRFLHGRGSLAELLTRYGVQLVFNGHMHGYERNTKQPGESFVSYVTGGGGETLEAVGSGGCGRYDAYAVGWSSTKGSGSRCGAARAPTAASHVYHFLLVTVSGSSVTVTPTDSTGRTFDVQTYRFPGVNSGRTASAAGVRRPRAIRAPIGQKGGIRAPQVACASPWLTPRVTWTVRSTATGARRTERWRGAAPRRTVLRVAVGRYASRTVVACGTRRTVARHAVDVRRKTSHTTMSRSEFRRIKRGMTRHQVTRIVGYAGRRQASAGGVRTVSYEIMRFRRWSDVLYLDGRVVAKRWAVRRG